MRSATETCQLLFQAAYDTHDAEALEQYLTDDITWHGDTELISANGRSSVLFILNYAMRNYMRNLKLKRIKLTDKLIRPGIFLVEGNMLLGDDITEDKGFRFAAICIEDDSTFKICNMQFHMLRSNTERSYSADRMLNSFYDGMPFSVLIFEHKNGEFTPLYFNEAFQLCMGRDKEACRAAFEQNLFWFVRQEDRAPIQDELKRVLSIVPNPRMICNFKTDEPTERWFRFFGNSFQWVDQREFVVASMIEITVDVKTNAQIREAIDNIPASICMLEVENHQVYQTILNKELSKILGYEQDDLYKRNIALDIDKIYPDDIGIVQETIDKILAGAQEVDVTFRLRGKQDSYLWMNLLAKRIAGLKSQDCYYGVYSNVDDKVRSHEALEVVRKKITKTVSLLPCAIAQFEIDSDLIKLAYFSDQLCDMLGLSRDEYQETATLGDPFRAIMPHETSLEIKKYLSSEETAPSTVYTKVKRRDGVDLCLRILYGAVVEKTIKSLYMVIEDATTEVRLKEAELWQNERYRILSASSDATIIDYNLLQKELTYDVFSTHYNTNQKKVFYTDQVSFDETLVEPEDLSAVQILLKRLEREAFRGTMELRARLSTSDFRWHRLHYVSLAGSDGTIFRILCRLEDIQDEKEMELAQIEKVKREIQFHKSIVRNTIFAKMFNITKDEWVPTKYDVLLDSMQEEHTFHKTLLTIANEEERPEEHIQLLKEFSDIRNQVEQELEISREFQIKMRNSSMRQSTWAQLTIAISYEKTTKNFFASLLLNDISEQKKQELIEWTNANIDTLTGLKNRRSFEQELSRYLYSSQNVRNHDCALACVEIDDMGRINELVGYEHGDWLLSQSAHTIQALLHGSEFACRNDGDKFLIVLEENRDQAQIEERLRILSTALEKPLNDQITATVSIGCTRIGRHDVFSRALYEQISKALFAAKKKGGGQYVIYSEEVDVLVKSEREHSSMLLDMEEQKIFVRTFGHFDVLLQDKAVYFNFPKAKELLALIVDRKGGYVSANDAIGYLWEDMPTTKSMYAKYRKTALQLKTILERNGIADIIETRNGKRRANINRFECDYYEYLQGTVSSARSYAGQYMIDYSWAEETMAVIDALKRNGSN